MKRDERYISINTTTLWKLDVSAVRRIILEILLIDCNCRIPKTKKLGKFQKNFKIGKLKGIFKFTKKVSFRFTEKSAADCTIDIDVVKADFQKEARRMCTAAISATPRV